MLVGPAGVEHPEGERERWPNRPMPTIARVAIVACLAVATVVAANADVRANRAEGGHRRDLEAHGVEVRAEVVEYDKAPKSDARITLLLLDGPFAGYTGTVVVARGPRATEGQVLTVFHSPDDVNDLVIEGYERNRRGTGWFLGSMTLVVAGALWLSHRRWRSAGGGEATRKDEGAAGQR